MQAFHCKSIGLIFHPLSAQAAERLGYPTRSRWPCWSASSRPAPTPATWCSIPSAAAAPPSPPPRSWPAVDRHRHHPPGHRHAQEPPERHASAWNPARITRSSASRGPRRRAAAGARRPLPVPVVGAVAHQARPLGGDGRQDRQEGHRPRASTASSTSSTTPAARSSASLVQVKSGHVKAGDIRDLRGAHRTRAGRADRHLPHPRRPQPRHGHRGRQRRVLPLRPVAEGLPAPADPHRGGITERRGGEDPAHADRVRGFQEG